MTPAERAKARARRAVLKMVKDSCELASRSNGVGPSNDPDAAVVYWLTTAVYWWGFYAEPLLPVRC